MEQKIKFKDLNGWLKVAIIMAYIDLAIYGFSFLLGFIEGLRT